MPIELVDWQPNFNHDQDTHLCVSGQERHVAHECEGTTKLPFSTPCISITTGLISIKLIYFMPSTYMTLCTKFQGNRLSSFWDKYLWKFPHFLCIFLRTILINNLSQRMIAFLWIYFFQIWYTGLSCRYMTKDFVSFLQYYCS